MYEQTHHRCNKKLDIIDHSSFSKAILNPDLQSHEMNEIVIKMLL